MNAALEAAAALQRIGDAIGGDGPDKAGKMLAAIALFLEAVGWDAPQPVEVPCPACKLCSMCRLEKAFS